MANPPESKKAILPPSATCGWIIAAGFLAWAGSLWLERVLKMQDMVAAVFICVAALVAVNYSLDILVLKVHRRESTGLDWASWNPSWSRTFVKFLGLLASLGLIGLLYWLFPEYSRDFFGDHKDHPEFYGEYRQMLVRVLPWWLALAIPYFYFIDARQREQRDGYFMAGMAVTLQFRKVNPEVLWQHVLSWLVKGYFLALMFTYCVQDTRTFIHYDFSIIRNFHTIFDFCYALIFLADLGFACAGYLFSLRICDTHVRRTESTFRGWIVALICYEPFWTWISTSYLHYSNDHPWGPWLEGRPVLYDLWGSTILGLYGVYVWATMMFGTRFSNLTNRGILTNGPYRWTKHPAYIAKNLAFWLISVPFVVSQSAGDSIRRCLLLGFLNYVYYLRARTEEANLSSDPTYVLYTAWIQEHGIFRRLRRARF